MVGNGGAVGSIRRHGKSPLDIPPGSQTALKSFIWLPPSPGHGGKGRKLPPGMVAGGSHPEIPGEYQSRPRRASPDPRLHHQGIYAIPPGKFGRAGAYHPGLRIRHGNRMAAVRHSKSLIQRPLPEEPLPEAGGGNPPSPGHGGDGREFPAGMVAAYPAAARQPGEGLFQRPFLEEPLPEDNGGKAPRRRHGGKGREFPPGMVAAWLHTPGAVWRQANHERPPCVLAARPEHGEER